jgi:hypothetical protein
MAIFEQCYLEDPSPNLVRASHAALWKTMLTGHQPGKNVHISLLLLYKDDSLCRQPVL